MSLRSRARAYLSVCSFHGVRDAAKAKNWLERGLWILLTTIATVEIGASTLHFCEQFLDGEARWTTDVIMRSAGADGQQLPNISISISISISLACLVVKYCFA